METLAEAADRLDLETPSRGHRWWAVPITLLSLFALVAIGVTSVLPSELVASKENPRTGDDEEAPFARTPAAASPVGERLTFGDLGDLAEQFPSEGQIYFVTVTEPSQSVLSWLVGQEEPAVQFLTETEKFGVQTPSQRRRFAIESMRTSEQVAQFVALQRVGFDVELTSGDVLISEFVCFELSEDGSECAVSSPSAEVLEPGDQILAVDGEPVEGVEDLARILEGLEPGDVVSMRIDRADAGELDVDVELTFSPDDPDRTIVGFFPFDTRQVTLPFELDIDTGQIGGPSAGLAFTLTMIDELTPGELTGGERVAVTGTIQLDGTVGAIGGLRQKASAAAQTGVEVFLVPAAQGEADIEAAREAGGDDLEIIPVADLEEALDALVALGGDEIPPPPQP